MSRKHANFFVNTGDATAKDGVFNGEGKNYVSEQSGIELINEEVVGDSKDESKRQKIVVLLGLNLQKEMSRNVG